MTRLLTVVLSIILSTQALFAAENLSQVQELPGVLAGKAAWADFDQDGFLDLALIGTVVETGSCVRIARLYRNSGLAGGGLLNTTPTQDLVGVYRGDLGWGDYDGDGDLDLAVAGWSEGGSEVLKIYRNEPTGTLTLDQEEEQVVGVSGLIGVRYASLAWEDYDNDADLDLIVSGMNSNGVSLTQLYANDDGDFEPDDFNSETVLNLHNGALAWADYDNDGDPDLVVTGENVNSLGEANVLAEFYKNDPVGTLSPDATLSITPVKGGSIAWTDYDDDGNVDLAVSGRTRPWEIDFGLYQNRPTGVLTRINMSTQFAVSSGEFVAGDLAWVDYDNDGDADLATTGVPSQLAAGLSDRSDYESNVYANEDGVFTRSENLDFALAGGVAAWGDYDVDGRIDLVTTGISLDGERRTVLYHNEIVAVNTPPERPDATNAPTVTGTSVTFSWLPGTDDNTNRLTYNLSIGSAERSLTAEQIAAGLSPTTDDIFSGSVDVGTGNTGVQTTKIIDRALPGDDYYWSVQSVDGSFARSEWTQAQLLRVEPLVDSEQRVRDLRETEMAWGDYDADGDPDLAIMGLNRNGDAQTLIYENVSGTLQVRLDAQIFFASKGDLAWGDYDRDGDLDLVITGSDEFDNRRTFLYQTEAGAFSAVGTFDQVASSALDWGDADNDGDLDLALLGLESSGASLTKVYLNDGQGGFDDGSSQQLMSLLDGEAAWADHDNDGDLDLALSGFNSTDGTQLLIYGNDPLGSLTEVQSLTGVQGSDLAWGDYDGDGDLDLVAGGDTGTGGDSPVLSTILYDNDAGTLSANQEIAFPGIRQGDLAWGDYDNDQFMDLFIVGSDANTTLTLAVYRNLLGSLTTPDSPFEIDGNLADLQASQGVDFSAVSVADIDGDGDLELISAGRSDLITAAPTTTINDNIIAATNFPPGVPPATLETVAADEVLFSWEVGSDAPAEHSLTYNLRVGTGSDSNDIMSGNVPIGLGNVGTNLSHRLRGLASSSYFWSVQSIDDGLARSDWSTPREFIVDTVRPTVSSVSLSRAQAGIGQTITVALEFQDEHSGVDVATSPAVDASIGDQTFPFTQLQFNSSSWSGELTVTPDMPTGLASLVISNVADQIGNQMLVDTRTDTLSVDTELPSVETSSPAAGATDVASSTNEFTITLSEPIDQSTATSSNFQIKLDNQPLEIVTEPDYDGDRTVQLFPSEDLKPGTLYTVQVSAAIQDLFGNRPANDSTWTFSTAIPEILTVSPDDGEEIASGERQVTVTFSSPIDRALLTPELFRLSRGGVAVPFDAADFDFDDETLQALFPRLSLEPGSQYEVAVSSQVRGPLGADQPDRQWTFNTQVPMLRGSQPATGESDIEVSDATISIEFDIPPASAVFEQGVVELLAQGDSVAIGPVSLPDLQTPEIISFEPVAERLLAGTAYQVRISAAAGGPRQQDDYVIDFNTKIPSLESTNPAADSEVDAAEFGVLEIDFTDPIDTAKADTIHFVLLRDGQPVTLRENDPALRDSEYRSFALAPADDWQVGSSYTLQISPAVGGPLGPSQPITRQFLTTVPAILTQTPTSGEISVPTDAAITVEFDVPPDEVVRDEGVVRLVKQGTDVETLSVSLEGSTLTIDPNAQLSAGTFYGVVIPSIAGGPRRAEPYAWTFSTVVPGLVSSTPDSGATGVDVGIGRVDVTFSAPCRPGASDSRQLLPIQRG